jgi:hypothetical protein
MHAGTWGAGVGHQVSPRIFSTRETMGFADSGTGGLGWQASRLDRQSIRRVAQVDLASLLWSH